MIKMTSRKLSIIVLSILVPVLLGGCSIKPVPYDESFYYEDEYYDEYYYGGGFYGDPVRYDDYNYRAWQMSQYYRHANEPDYQAYVDVNIENNANRSSGSYRSGETPVKQASNRSSQAQQLLESNRVKQRKDANDQKVSRAKIQDSQSSEIGKEQKSKAEQLRRERMKEARNKRAREKEEDKELTEEELEKQRQKTRRKKK